MKEMVGIRGSGVCHQTIPSVFHWSTDKGLRGDVAVANIPMLLDFL